MGEIIRKFAIARHVVPTIWPIQKGSNLTQKKVITLEKATRFSFDCLHKNNTRNLFGSQSYSSSNSHVPIVSCHNLVRLSNSNCWPTTHDGKKVRRPFVFKITQHTNNREAGILLLQCIVFPTIDVPPPGYGQIYNILSNDKLYDVIISNFLICSCVYFVRMLVGSLGGYGAYV